MLHRALDLSLLVGVQNKQEKTNSMLEILLKEKPSSITISSKRVRSTYMCMYRYILYGIAQYVQLQIRS